MRLKSLLQEVQHIKTWASAHQPLLGTLTGAALLLIVVAVDRVSAATRRSDILFLVQVGGLIFLVVYVVATNRIAQASQSAAKATEDSAHAAQQAVEAASRSLQVSEAMLAEAKATRIAQELQSAPRVVVYAEMEGLIRYFAIENTGLSFANDVTVTFTPPLTYNAFPGGMIPDFFTGSAFTLKPGQKIRQPLSQEYRPIISLTSAVTQTATARYRGGILSDEAVEIFPINLRGYENILVTETDIERALDKLGKLVTAVEQTEKAVNSVAKRLDDSVLVSATLLNEQGAVGDRAAEGFFLRLIGGLNDDWRIWKERGESHPYMRRPMDRRFSQQLEAALAMLAHLSISEEEAMHVRALFFDIQQALAYPYRTPDSDPATIITRSLTDLMEIARSLISPATSSSNMQAETAMLSAMPQAATDANDGNEESK